jgi:hypothetical protein
MTAKMLKKIIGKKNPIFQITKAPARMPSAAVLTVQ